MFAEIICYNGHLDAISGVRIIRASEKAAAILM